MIADLMDAWPPTYQELQETYATYYSLAGLNTSLENKFGLISLICFLTKQAKRKNPDVTCWQVIRKITENDLPSKDLELFHRGLSIICEDFMQHTTDFLTFDMKTSKDMINKIREILSTWLPF